MQSMDVSDSSRCTDQTYSYVAGNSYLSVPRMHSEPTVFMCFSESVVKSIISLLSILEPNSLHAAIACLLMAEYHICLCTTGFPKKP